MSHPRENAVRHYRIKGLTDLVASALRETYGSLHGITPADLIAVDNFHIRGLTSTKELAELVNPPSGSRILDAGAGPGGTARYLAQNYGCEVIGLDITLELVDLARYLSEIVNLEGSTAFFCGNALEMPFMNECFDCVWMDHVQMNISDKELLVSEIGRVLEPGGILALHEVFNGPGGEPFLPTPWSEDRSGSFLVRDIEMRQLLVEQGFEVLEWRDVSNLSRHWFAAAERRIEESGFPVPGLDLLMGDSAREKMACVRRNLEEERLTLTQGVLIKRG